MSKDMSKKFASFGQISDDKAGTESGSDKGRMPPIPTLYPVRSGLGKKKNEYFKTTKSNERNYSEKSSFIAVFHVGKSCHALTLWK
jgi:hypothetical protein